MKQFIDWNSIEVKGNRTGSKKTTCPACSENRRNKKDPCLSVNFDKGLANCFHCGAVGFRPDENYKPTYTPPPQDWQNHTSLSDKMVKYCAERGIPQRTLIDFRVTEEKTWLPQTGKEENCIVFNYFEGDKVVNKKYRDGRKNFTQSKDGKKLLYNVNAAIGQKELYIVEGEFDVLAMAANGIDNVVSLVNGANDHDDQWINSQPYIEDVERFIIAVDNDEKGIEVREKIAHRLGKWKCSYIEWTEKDANGSVINGTFEDDLKKVVRFPVSGTHSVKDLEAGIFDLYKNGVPKTIIPKHKSFENVNGIFSVMRGHLVTVTGIPSGGKSNYVEWYVLNLVH
jgi:DNA primase (bacterial type)